MGVSGSSGEASGAALLLLSWSFFFFVPPLFSGISRPIWEPWTRLRSHLLWLLVKGWELPRITGYREVSLLTTSSQLCELSP